MSLTLKTVRLHNFRIHADYVFEPDRTGVTAIIGRNGHGKSTIIDGIAWALYGTKPNSGVKNSSWRRIGTPDDDNSYVDVTMDLDGHELRVKRTLIGPKASTVTCECWLDGTLEAGPAVSHAAKWIVNTLQMDESGFLSTIFVQQKHVGQLVSASRAERRRILERLTGITAVTAALDKAKEEEKITSRAAGNYHVDETQLPKLRKTIEAREKEQAKLQKTIDRLQGQLDKSGDEGKKLRKELDEEEAQFERKRSLENELSQATASYESYQQRQEELEAQRERLSNELPATKFDVDAMNEIANELDNAENKLSKLTSRKESLLNTINQTPSDADFDRIRENIANTKKKLATLDRGAIEEELESIRTAKANDEAAINQAHKSLSELNGEEAVCPTCLQPIDDPKHLLDELNGTIDEAGRHKKSLKVKYDEANRKLAKYDELDATLKKMNDELHDMNERSQESSTARHELTELNADISAGKIEVEALRKSISRFEANKVKYEEYDRTLKGLSETVATVQQFKTTIDRLTPEVQAIKVDNDRLAKKRAVLDEKREKFSELKTRMAEKQGELNLAMSEADGASRELEMLESQVDEHRNLMQSLEIASTAAGLIGRFREHMIMESIPRMTEYASELIERISGGDFVSVVIDKSFNITVEGSDGSIRSVSQLSGGEEDLVAICLRLAISMMLADGAPSMLVLDEVLTAMDSERAASILEVMEGMSDGQIIIVAHNEVVKSIADKIVEV